MKRLIYRISIFIIIIIVFNILYIQFLKHYDYGFKKTYAIAKMENQDYDCIFLGNSVAYDGLDTGYLTKKGLSSYNFALGGENLQSSYIQLDTYLKKNNKPKVVIYGLSPGNYDGSNLPKKIHPSVAYNYGLIDKFTVRSIPVIKFQWLAIEPVKKLFSKDHREARVVKGQLRTRKIIPDNTRYKENLKKTIRIDDFDGAVYLFKMDSICSINNIPFFALGMPGYRSTQNEIPEGLQILKYGIDKNLHFINLNNREFCFKTFDYNKDWLGNSHLNEYGARKFTKYLYNNHLKDYNSK